MSIRETRFLRLRPPNPLDDIPMLHEKIVALESRSRNHVDECIFGKVGCQVKIGKIIIIGLLSNISAESIIGAGQNELKTSEAATGRTGRTTSPQRRRRRSGLAGNVSVSLQIVNTTLYNLITFVNSLNNCLHHSVACNHLFRKAAARVGRAGRLP